MPSEELNIILSITDKLSAGIDTVQKNLSSLQKNVQDFSKDMGRMGTTIQRAGMNMAFLGAAMTGPLLLAFKSASKESFEISYQMERLNNIASEFRKSIATAMVPTMEKLTSILNSMLNQWNRLTPATQQAIIQTIFISGLFLTLFGTVGMLTGRIIKLTSVFLGFAITHPILMLIAGIVLIIAMNFEKLKTIVEPVLIFMENSVRMVYIGLLKFADGILFVIEKINTFLRRPVDNIIAIREEIAAQIKNMENDITTSLATGESISINFLENIKNKVQALWKTLANPPDMKNLGLSFKSAAKSMEGFIETGAFYFSFLSQTVQMAAAESKKFAVLLKATRIGEAIINTAVAVTRAFKDFPWPLSLIVAGMMSALGAAQVAIISAQKMHKGGLIRAHEGLAVDEVPIIAQRGEGILSRRGMGALGGVGELARLNAGAGGRSNITVHIQNASFRNEDDITDIFNRLNFLIQTKQRSRI